MTNPLYGYHTVHVAGNYFILERQTGKTYFQELIGNFRN